MSRKEKYKRGMQIAGFLSEENKLDQRRCTFKNWHFSL